MLAVDLGDLGDGHDGGSSPPLARSVATHSSAVVDLGRSCGASLHRAAKGGVGSLSIAPGRPRSLTPYCCASMRDPESPSRRAATW